MISNRFKKFNNELQEITRAKCLQKEAKKNVSRRVNEPFREERSSFMRFLENENLSNNEDAAGSNSRAFHEREIIPLFVSEKEKQNL